MAAAARGHPYFVAWGELTAAPRSSSTVKKAAIGRVSGSSAVSRLPSSLAPTVVQFRFVERRVHYK